MTPYADRLEDKLTAAFAPVHLHIHDDSHRHAGHNPDGPGHAPLDSPVTGYGETHFNIEITAEAFRGLSRVAAQRLVYAVVADELRERVHALSLICKAP